MLDHTMWFNEFSESGSVWRIFTTPYRICLYFSDQLTVSWPCFWAKSGLSELSIKDY